MSVLRSSFDLNPAQIPKGRKNKGIKREKGRNRVRLCPGRRGSQQEDIYLALHEPLPPRTLGVYDVEDVEKLPQRDVWAFKLVQQSF